MHVRYCDAAAAWLCNLVLEYAAMLMRAGVCILSGTLLSLHSEWDAAITAVRVGAQEAQHHCWAGGSL